MEQKCKLNQKNSYFMIQEPNRIFTLGENKARAEACTKLSPSIFLGCVGEKFIILSKSERYKAVDKQPHKRRHITHVSECHDVYSIPSAGTIASPIAVITAKTETRTP